MYKRKIVRNLERKNKKKTKTGGEIPTNGFTN